MKKNNEVYGKRNKKGLYKVIKPVMSPNGENIQYPGISELCGEQKEARKIMYKPIVLKFEKITIKDFYESRIFSKDDLIKDRPLEHWYLDIDINMEIVKCDSFLNYFNIYKDSKGEYILLDYREQNSLIKCFEFKFNSFGFHNNNRLFKIYLDDSLNDKYVGKSGDYEINTYFPRPAQNVMTPNNVYPYGGIKMYLMDSVAKQCIKEGLVKTIDNMKVSIGIRFETFTVLEHKPTGQITTLD